MIQLDTVMKKLSTRKLYLIALALLVLGFGLRLGVRLKAAYTSCGLACENHEFFSHVVAPIGAVLFLAGLTLMVATAVRYFILRRKR